MTTGLKALMLGFLMGVSLAAEQVRDDFAAGFTIEHDVAGPLLELSLPEAVYETLVRPDLGDLRVFDRHGTAMPHVVRRPRARFVAGPAPRSLPFFPLRGSTRDGAAGQTLRIVTDERGAIIDVIGADAPGGEAVEGYLIDLSALAEPPDVLELEWERAATEGFVVTLDVESSDDLSQWRTVARGVTLADLRSGGATLVHDAIGLPPIQGEYLRIGWPAALTNVPLVGARGLYSARAQSLARATMRVPGVDTGDPPGVFDFDSGGFRPVDQVQIVFDRRSAVLDAVLLSRQTPDEPWRRRHAGAFYRLEREGVSLRNEPVSVAMSRDRYWRLEVAGGQAWAGEAPTLELGWAPDLLTVVAQGDRPFTVAFGSATVVAATRPTAGLLAVIDEEETRGLIAPGGASEVFTLGGESKLAPPLPWKTWVLWGVLIVGVGVLGWMVWQLAARVTPPP